MAPPSAVENESTLPSVLRVARSSEAFSSRAYSEVSLPAGSVLTKITGTTPAKKAYTSVQVGPDSHIELNSDLVYCDHSCDPSVVFDMSKMEVRVVDDRDLKAGDPLTFFYPSSEWDMGQPFDCRCGAGSKCNGRISGAKDMDPKVLEKYWLNPHIREMLKKNNA